MMIRFLCLMMICLMFCGCGKVNMTFNSNTAAPKDFNPNDPLILRRIIFVNGCFNEAMARSVCTELVYLDSQSKTKPITMCINSGGGDLMAFLAIRNMINSISAPVDTVNMGFSGSAAVLLYLSATGKRYCIKDSSFGIHEPTGNPKEHRKHYVELQENLLRTKCELPEDWLPIKSRQFFVNDNDAKKYKICDEIIEKIEFSVYDF